MCCNTAHFAIEELQEQIGIQFINLLEEVAKEANLCGAKRIGMMCSDGLRKFKLYDDYFNVVNHEMSLVYPNDELQSLVTLGICNSKNSKRDNPEDNEYPEKLFSEVCNWFVEQGVDCIVGGCTDISAVFSPIEWKGANYIESMQVLADTIVNNHRISIILM